VAEGTRLLSEYGGKLPSRVRIPPSPLVAARPGELRTRGFKTAERPLPSLTRAPVAQLDRASVYGTEGHRFESCRARSPDPVLKGISGTWRTRWGGNRGGNGTTVTGLPLERTEVPGVYRRGAKFVAGGRGLPHAAPHLRFDADRSGPVPRCGCSAGWVTTPPRSRSRCTATCSTATSDRRSTSAANSARLARVHGIQRACHAAQAVAPNQRPRARVESGPDACRASAGDRCARGVTWSGWRLHDRLVPMEVIRVDLARYCFPRKQKPRAGLNSRAASSTVIVEG
jgi:hypothetical protein